jgi:very-short-patch-repair endonuclease
VGADRAVQGAAECRAVAGREIDFLWRAEGIAVEVDGYRYHSSRSRFESDRRRTAYLAAHGIQVIPVTWRQIVDEGTATVVQLGGALLRAREP